MNDVIAPSIEVKSGNSTARIISFEGDVILKIWRGSELVFSQIYTPQQMLSVLSRDIPGPG